MILLANCGAPPAAPPQWPSGAWSRYTIDSSSLGADGVRLADINRDGRVDIASPWEQGGQVRVYLHPGTNRLREPWPAVTVGKVGDPEDSFFVDLDGNGQLDVVSSCEGRTRSIYVHWAPPNAGDLLNPSVWVTEPVPAAKGAARWMFATAMQLDGRNGVDLIAGSKGEGAQLGWLQAPANPRDLGAWQWRPLYDAGWLMTVRPVDLDQDGDADILATDRNGPRRGALWLENPGPARALGRWREHRIGPVNDHEAMHNTIADLDEDGLEDVLVAVKGGPIRYHRRTRRDPPAWQTHRIAMPPHSGTGKSVQVADIDLDGQRDVVVACEHATDGRIGVFWLSPDGAPTDASWTATSISGPEGFIYDLMELTDLDGDGDQDLITLEEKGPYLAAGYEGSELGVIWYENPAR